MDNIKVMPTIEDMNNQLEKMGYDVIKIDLTGVKHSSFNPLSIDGENIDLDKREQQIRKLFEEFPDIARNYAMMNVVDFVFLDNTPEWKERVLKILSEYKN